MSNGTQWLEASRTHKDIIYLLLSCCCFCDALAITHHKDLPAASEMVAACSAQIISE